MNTGKVVLITVGVVVGLNLIGIIYHTWRAKQ